MALRQCIQERVGKDNALGFQGTIGQGIGFGRRQHDTIGAADTVRCNDKAAGFTSFNDDVDGCLRLRRG